jgi:hypothetical protein
MGRVLTAYLALAGVLSALSVPLYVLEPAGSALRYGGVPSPTSNTWVTIVAPGNALCAVLALSGVFSYSPFVRRLAVRRFVPALRERFPDAGARDKRRCACSR